jgi:carbonic anhydrase/acetyltransferase-like protein (isoleucine patch superfamily)
MLERFRDNSPQVAKDAFVHEHACLIGNVSVETLSSIWPGVILRGDMGAIKIGKETSIQDGSVAHITEGLSETIIGNRVTVGHRVILHGCIVEDECLIGMGSILLDNCVIGKGSLVAAGTLVTAGTQVPENSLVMGSPGKVIRRISDREQMMIEAGWQTYVAYTKEYLGRT